MTVRMPRYSGANLKLVKKPYIGRAGKRFTTSGRAKASVVGTRQRAYVVTPGGGQKRISRRGAPAYERNHPMSIQPIKKQKTREQRIGTALTFKNPLYKGR